MCPIASLFDLIEDPCKSMWKLFSGVTFRQFFQSKQHPSLIFCFKIFQIISV